MKSTLSRFIDLRAFCVGAALIVFASCSNESTTVPSNPQLGVYIQLDRLGRPGVKELFEMFSDHDTSNRNSPGNDPALAANISSFVTGVAQRSSAVQANAGSIFAIDELQLNLGASGSAGYLGIETNNAVGTAFGGRSLTDDVMGVDLNAAFGTLLGTDSNANACLATDNVGSTQSTATTIAATDNETTTFPYVGKPH